MMGFNPERFQEAMVILNKYKDPTTNYLDANNPDYLAEIAALNQKYAPAQTQQAPVQTQQAPAQTQTQQAPAQTQQASAQDDKVQVFSQVGQLGAGKGYSTIQDVVTSLGGQAGQVERLYFKDPETGRVFNYDYDDSEFENLDPGYYGKSLSDLQLISGLTKPSGSDENVSFTVEDPSKYDVSGILGYDPETSAKMAAEQAKDDPSDNDIYYEHNGTTYVDVSGTGQGIPVGSTNITKDPTFINEDGTLKVDTSGNTAVLSKGFSGYYDQNTEFDKFKADQAPEPKDLTFGNVFSLTPGGAVIDTGLKNPFGEGNIEFSNPPSQLQNLEPFFNQVESIGYNKYKEQTQSTTQNPLEKLLGVQPVPKSVGEMIQETGGSNIFPDQGDSGGGSGGGGGDDDDNGGGGGGGGGDDSTTPPKFAFAPPMKSAPISTAPDEPINTDPRFQPIFPQQPIQPVGDITNFPNPYEGPFGPGGIGSEGAPPQASPAMPQPQPIPIEAQPAVMPPSFMDPAQSVPSVIPPETFADVMHRGGAKGQPGINPYFQDIEQINRSAPYSPIIGMAGGGGIMSLQNRMLMDPASRAMSQGIMS